MMLAMPRSCVHLLGNAWTECILNVMKDLLCRRNIWEAGNLCKSLQLCSIWSHWRSWGNSWDIREMSFVVFPSSAVLFIHYLNNRSKSVEKLITENFFPSNRGAHPAAFNQYRKHELQGHEEPLTADEDKPPLPRTRCARLHLHKLRLPTDPSITSDQMLFSNQATQGDMYFPQ